MKEYLVKVPEVHYREYTVRAEKEEQAKELVEDGQGDESITNLTFSQVLSQSEYEWDTLELDDSGLDI